MRKLFVTSVVVALLASILADANSGLEVGEVNVLSRNVTRWKHVTKDVSIDTFTYGYCGPRGRQQCRTKSGTRTESQQFIIATVETELYCRPGFYQTGGSCEDDCEDTKHAQGVCFPQLDQCCQNGGVCLDTNHGITCNCSDGWTGDYCSERCPVYFYGPRCSLECPACSNGGTCDPVTGQCDCSPGWTGPTCDEKCSSGWYGKDCALDCRSCTLDDGQCHHITGECECAVPYGGQNCAETCHDGKYVQCGWFPNCCRNGAKCVQIDRDSRCHCPPGYKGKFCGTRCTDSWGDECRRRCLCNNNGTCDPTTGECECTPGWFGKYCTESFKTTTDSLKCPTNCSEDYGCDQDGRCICPSNLTWNEETSSCLRMTEYIQTSTVANNNDNLSVGKVAESNSPNVTDESLLEVGAVNVLSRNVTRWKHVTKDVSIDTFTYGYCGPRGQQCRTKSGTRTESQQFIIATEETELYCRPGFYQTGGSCEDDCEKTKQSQGVCSPQLDQCCQNWGICLDTNYGTTCNCSDGWTGDYCSERCPVNFYGPRCSLECPACSNGGTCDPVTGQCDCSPGWTGPTCDEKCISGWYGKDCALDCRSCTLDDGQCHHITGVCECSVPYGGQRCAETCHGGKNVQCGWFPNCCRNGATCVQTDRDSRCQCTPGYKGKFCETRCTEFWGAECRRTCLCNNNGTCDPTTGECECTSGWFGKYCQDRFKTTTDSLKCPVNCSEDYGCDQVGRCICPSNLTWNEETSSCLRMTEYIQTSTVANNNDNLRTVAPERSLLTTAVTSAGKVAESNSPNVTISLIAVCGVLAVFVLVALVLALRNKGHEVKPLMIVNERRESRSRRMLPTALKIKGGNDGVGDDNILPVNRQPENEDATYSVVKDDLL